MLTAETRWKVVRKVGYKSETNQKLITGDE